MEGRDGLDSHGEPGYQGPKRHRCLWPAEKGFDSVIGLGGGWEQRERSIGQTSGTGGNYSEYWRESAGNGYKSLACLFFCLT